MHSKRALYKPAVTGNVTPKEKRKPLVQGRLVTKTQEVGKDENFNPDDGLPVPLPTVREDSSARCRQDLSTRIRTCEKLPYDPSSSPRRDQPQISFHDSPRVVHPSQSLDVSDAESELLNYSKKSGDTSIHSPRDVLVVDASMSSAQGSAHSVEVAVAMAYANSPARVVCHSPGRVQGNLRHTGDVSLGAQIRVDRLPKVSIAMNSSYEEDPSKHTHNQQSHTQSSDYASNHPVVIYSDSPEDSLYKKSKVVQALFPDADKKSNSPLRETTINSTHNSNHSYQSSIDSRASDISEITREINKENLDGELKPKKTSKSETMPIPEAPKSGKKKKAPRFVASRYLSTTSTGTSKSVMLAPKLSMKADKSVTQKTKSCNNTTSKIKNNKKASGSVTRKVAPANGSRSTQHKVHKKNPGKEIHGPTPDTNRIASGTKSSTPTAESAASMGLLGPDVSVDVSAIGPPADHIQSSMLAASFDAFDLHNPPGSGKKKHCTSLHPTHYTSGVRKKLSHDWSTSSTRFSQDSKLSGSKKQNEHRVTQQDLDIAYSRYIQMVFLDSRAKMAFKAQEKHVMHQLNSLWLENQKLQQKKEEMTAKLNQMKYINNLDQCLDTQESGLTTLTSTLPQFNKEYNSLAQALDNTQHHITTRGIHLPQNQLQFQDEMCQALSESEQLLGELSVMTRPHTTATETLATSLDKMVSTLSSELEDFKRCAELVAAANSLSTQESSLQIQLMQTGQNTTSAP